MVPIDYLFLFVAWVSVLVVAVRRGRSGWWALLGLFIFIVVVVIGQPIYKIGVGPHLSTGAERGVGVGLAVGVIVLNVLAFRRWLKPKPEALAKREGDNGTDVGSGNA